MIDVNRALAQPLAETFQASGVAATIPQAHDLAWNALTAVLGDDRPGPWKLKGMQCVYSTNPSVPGVQFLAEFLRDPEEDEVAS